MSKAIVLTALILISAVALAQFTSAQNAPPTLEKKHYNYSEWTKGRFSEAVTVTGPGPHDLSRGRRRGGRERRARHDPAQGRFHRAVQIRLRQDQAPCWRGTALRWPISPRWSPT